MCIDGGFEALPGGLVHGHHGCIATFQLVCPLDESPPSAVILGHITRDKLTLLLQKGNVHCDVGETNIMVSKDR
jgi:RIO-like serine/threonine protein kinase